MSRLPAAQRRAQLLQRAAQLFAERGYARATTAQLARSAGVTEPIIYRHFKSKRHLFVALIEQSGDETISMWKRHLKGAADPAERLRRLLGENPMVSPGGRDAYRVLLQAITEVDDPEICKAVNDHIHGLHRFLVEELEAAQREHRITSRFPADLVAWVLIDIGLGYGVLSSLRVEGHGRAGSSGFGVREAVTRLLVGRRGMEGADLRTGSDGASAPAPTSPDDAAQESTPLAPKSPPRKPTSKSTKTTTRKNTTRKPANGAAKPPSKQGKKLSSPASATSKEKAPGRSQAAKPGNRRPRKP